MKGVNMTVKELKEILNMYEGDVYVGIGYWTKCDDNVGEHLKYYDIDDVYINEVRDDIHRSPDSLILSPIIN